MTACSKVQYSTLSVWEAAAPGASVLSNWWIFVIFLIYLPLNFVCVCVCVCVCVHVYVVYEDTNLYDDIGMT